MNFARILFVLLAASSTAFANDCDPRMFAGNGLYYAADGDPASARRLELEEYRSSDGARILALETLSKIPFAKDGKLFIRSGFGGEDWIGLGALTSSDDAVYVRRYSTGNVRLRPKYVSVLRKDLGSQVCPAFEDGQKGLPDRKLFRIKNFVAFHKRGPDETFNDDLANQFHFKFNGLYGQCLSTRDVRDPNNPGQVNLKLIDKFYNGPGVAAPTTEAQKLAEVFVLPSAAIAGTSTGTAPIGTMSSVDVSLHARPRTQDYCMALTTPMPTGNFPSLLELGLRSAKSRAERWARRNNWKPVMSHIDLLRISSAAKIAEIRVHWR